MKIPSLRPLRRHLFHHPLIIIPPLAILLAFAWQQYIAANRNLNFPSSINLLSASYNSSSSGSSTLGWKASHSGSATYTTQQQQGIVSDKAIKLSITNYNSGDVALTGPKVTLEPNKNYLFKGFYTSSTPFTLLAHYYYADGTDMLVDVQRYPAKRDGWTTASHAFASKNITAVQFVYKLAQAGEINIDGVYLEPKNDIVLPQAYPSSTNIIPNSSLASTNFDMPDAWISYQSGDSTAAFSYLTDTKGAYLKTVVKDFRSGEAKWQHTPQTILPYNRYKFGVNYQSEYPVDIMAEYILKDGRHVFESLGTLPPAGLWTKTEQLFEAPPQSSELTVSLVLKGNGSLLSRAYTLENITKPGNITWKRPLVSITFDDGWRGAYSQAVPVLNKYGYKGTFYITPSIIETPYFMSAADLTVLSKTGHEIAAHGYSHSDMTMMSQSAIDNQLRQGQKYLVEAGFSAHNFAVPYGKSDAEVEWFAKKYFTTVRSANSGINTKQSSNPYNLRTLVVKKETDQATIKKALEKTRQTNGWLILVYHNVNLDGAEISTSKADNSSITTKAFTDQIAELRKANLTVLPIEKAFKEIADQ